jgi:hypothetical protein
MKRNGKCGGEKIEEDIKWHEVARYSGVRLVLGITCKCLAN